MVQRTTLTVRTVKVTLCKVLRALEMYSMGNNNSEEDTCFCK